MQKIRTKICQAKQVSHLFSPPTLHCAILDINSDWLWWIMECNEMTVPRLLEAPSPPQGSELDPENWQITPTSCDCGLAARSRVFCEMGLRAANVISCDWVKAGGWVNCLDILPRLLIFSDNVTLCHVHQDLSVATCPRYQHIATQTSGNRNTKLGAVYILSSGVTDVCVTFVSPFLQLSSD